MKYLQFGEMRKQVNIEMIFRLNFKTYLPKDLNDFTNLKIYYLLKMIL